MAQPKFVVKEIVLLLQALLKAVSKARFAHGSAKCYPNLQYVISTTSSIHNAPFYPERAGSTNNNNNEKRRFWRFREPTFQIDAKASLRTLHTAEMGGKACLGGSPGPEASAVFPGIVGARPPLRESRLASDTCVRMTATYQ